MTFRLRVPSAQGDDNSTLGYDDDVKEKTPSEREFMITPEYGSIPPMGTQQVQVDFKPRSVGAYNRQLVVDVESVGPRMKSLDIQAHSIAPRV